LTVHRRDAGREQRGRDRFAKAADHRVIFEPRPSGPCAGLRAGSSRYRAA
jgi:hypothetical protein